MHGRDCVAPPGNQAATERTNFGLNVGEELAHSWTTVSVSQRSPDGMQWNPGLLI